MGLFFENVFLPQRTLGVSLVSECTAEVADFLEERFDTGCGLASLASYCSARGFGRNIRGLQDPTDDFRMRRLLAGARRLRVQIPALPFHCLSLNAYAPPCRACLYPLLKEQHSGPSFLSHFSLRFGLAKSYTEKTQFENI